MKLSIIICSRKSKIPKDLVKNIDNTADCDYELIVIDNSQNNHSIFAAYNEGVKMSQGDVLCFMHDDIIYRTKGWGRKVLSYFSEECVGCIGVAGTKHFPRIPASWFSMKEETINIIQHYKEDDEGVLVKRGLSNEASKVVAIDGVWMCFPRSIFNKIRFDEKYGGFHAYDIDICMQVNALKKDILVVSDILIEHFSCGTISKDLFNSNLMFFNKWEKSLPKYVQSYNMTRKKKVAIWWYFWTFVNQMILYSYDCKTIRKYIRTILWKMPIVMNRAVVKIVGFYMKSFLCKKKG